MKLNSLFNDQFQCMFLPFEEVDFAGKLTRLNYDKFQLESMNLIKFLKYREVVLKLTKKGVGTFVISLFNMDAPYEYLQKKHKDTRLFYFWASNSFAYVKTLFGGKIQRKIASYGWFNDHTTSSEEQTLGKEPLEYEVEKGYVYKVTMDERMKFSKADMLEIFDYYIKLDRNADVDFDSVEVFFNLKSSNSDWSMKAYKKPEFLQSLIHVQKNYKAEFTIPFVVFEDRETLRFQELKNKQEISKLKSAKHLLNLNIFNAKKQTKILTNLFYMPSKFSFDSFLFDLARNITRALQLKESEFASGICIRPPEGEFIPATTSLIYFVVCFEDDGVKVEFYSLMRCGKSQNNEFICRLNSFEQNDLFVCYNTILDYLLNQDIVTKLNKK